jgi:formylglycine-generating enzyme required for sulfatase activity
VVPLGIRRALDHIKSIQNPQDTILFLDAFDEDTEAIQDHVRRLGTLMEASAAFRRVLITCRTQFFPTAEEIPTQTGVVRVGPRAAGESGGYEFRKLYLMPFDDSHVERYLRKRYRWRWITRRRARDLVNTVPLLSVRPMLLTHIPDVLASEKTVRTASELYQVVVDRWLKREDRWVDPEALRSFSERLAVNLYTNRAGRGTEHIPHTELTQLVADWELPALEDWQLRGRSLLNGDAEGNYKFAHRSIMEYLFVTQLLSANPECRGVELTDQMQFFLRELLLQRSSAAPREPLDLRAVVLCDMDLQGVNLQGADLRDADLSETDLRTANLRGANLRGANLRKVKLTVAQLEEANLQGADLTESFITNAFDMEFVWIPAGEFQMGSSDGYDNERPVHTVHIKEPFFMTKYPVTQGQWEAVMGNDPSHFKGDPQRPVENVSWHDVQAFLQALNQKEAGNAYRLPTEAEWEYACRASTTTAYSFGDDASQLGEYAWYEENSQERTHSVGQKKPNAWGLYDMHGNVWEWVQDCYHDSYTGAPIDGSAWEDDTPEYRVPVCARPPRLMH